MENNLTREETIILNLLLAKRNKNNIVKPLKQISKKEMIKEKESMRKTVDENEAKRIQRMINKNKQK